MNSTEELIIRNLATSLLFQGKYDDAEAIYRQYKDELKDSFLKDLQDFEAAGVIPEERKADVEKIRTFFNKKSQIRKCISKAYKEWKNKIENEQE